MKEIILVAHNIRSTHNIGSILRTADAFGVSKLIVSGYTPYPKLIDDTRLPHIAEKNTRDIAKTALGAELTMPIEVTADLEMTIGQLHTEGYTIAALEQSEHSQPLPAYHHTQPLVLILGEERYGIDAPLLARCDEVLEIPMLGRKESLNVSVATAICLYQLRYG